MKTTSIAIALALGLLLGGCATIISGSTQTISVNSDVPGAEVYLNEQPLGSTPLVTQLPRGQVGTLSVRKQGYQPYQVALNKQINGVFWVNILIGGTFGSSTDYSTGAMYEYSPGTYYASLRPMHQSRAEASAWRKQTALRAFLLMNGEALISDLAAGAGEHLDVLVFLLDVTPDQRGEAIARWRTSYATSHTAVEFSDRILAELPRS